MKTDVHLWSYLALFFLEWEMFQTEVGEKIKTHIVCSVTIFFENRAVCEIMWTNTAEPGRPQMTIWRMRIACWISMATYTLSEYVTLNVFPLQQWLNERASELRCMFIACLVFSKASRLALGPTEDPLQWVQVALYPGVEWQESEAIGLHIPLGLIFPHTSWSRVRGHLHPCRCNTQKSIIHLKLTTRIDLKLKLRTWEIIPHYTHKPPSLKTLLSPFFPYMADGSCSSDVSVCHPNCWIWEENMH